MIYIEFNDAPTSPIKLGWVLRIFGFLIPKANPDFEGKINHVVKWILEFESDNEIPIREIGLDNNGNVIVKMPDNKNMGFWTDNTMTLIDFKTRFAANQIDQLIFDNYWDTQIFNISKL